MAMIGVISRVSMANANLGHLPYFELPLKMGGFDVFRVKGCSHLPTPKDFSNERRQRPVRRFQL